MGCQRYPCGDLGLLNVATERTAACGRSAKLTGWAAFVFSLSSQSDWTPLEIIALSALPFFRRPSRPALVYRGERVQRAFATVDQGGAARPPKEWKCRQCDYFQRCPITLAA